MRGFILVFCLLSATTAAAQSEFWCWDADEIIVQVEGHTVRIQHLAALYNCCPEPITYVIEVGDATIFVEEHTLSVCDCDCCTKTEVTLEDVPAGPWNLLFRWFDLEIWEWVEEIIQIEVPDVGQEPGPVVAGQMYSGCLEASDVPDAVHQVGRDAMKVLTNPALGGVGFSVNMPTAGEATIRVFDVQGRLVETMFAGELPAGLHELTWRASNVGAASGIYYLRLDTHNRMETRRFVLLH